jgi:O-antigen ligase
VAGAAAALVVNPQKTATLLFLLVPLVPLFIPSAISQGLRKLRGLRRHLRWWHGLWLLLFLSALVFRIRGAATIKEQPVDLWAAYRILLVSVAALVLLVGLAFKRSDWTRSLFRGIVGALAFFVLISLASTLWSIYPAWTLYKSSEFFVDIALLAAILATVRSAEEYKTLFDWMWVLLAGLLGSVWMGALLWPDKAFPATGELIRVRIAGVLPALDQNDVGEAAAVLAIVALTRLQRPERRQGRVFYWLLFACALFTLILSQTRAAIIGFLLGSAIVLILSKRFGLVAVLGFAALVTVAVTNAPDLLLRFWQRGENAEIVQGFSGRLAVWQFGWTKFLERPLIGYGAYAGGRFGGLKTGGVELWSSVLSSYVETMLGTGLCGLTLLIAAVLGTWWALVRVFVSSSLRRSDRDLVIEALGVLALMTTRSFFAPQLIWHPAQTFLLVLGYAEFMRRARRSENALIPRIRGRRRVGILWRGAERGLPALYADAAQPHAQPPRVLD